LTLKFAYVEVNLQTCEQLEGVTNIDFTALKVKKLNKNRGLVGPVKINIPLDNTYTVEGKLYKKQGGEYKETPYKLPKKALCDFLNSDTFFLPKVQNASDIVLPFLCPLKIVKKVRGLLRVNLNILIFRQATI
jgi:hypothetical protein